MSKATQALAAQLVPESKTPRAEQFRIAWDLLLHLRAADEWHRSQAKCWLTYRAFDGQITMQDWKEKIATVSPKPTAWMKVRWGCSQATAEAFLWLHCGDEKEKTTFGVEKAESVLAMEPRLQHYPPTILNWLRIVAILAVRKWAIGCDAEAKDLIMRAVDRWRAVMSEFPWQAHPTRFREMDGDAMALTILMHLGAKLGLTSMPDYEWLSVANIMQKCKWQPWIVCLNAAQTKKRRLA